MKTEKLSDFFSLWDEISTDSFVPQSFIFMEGNTNMLIEVYVILHLLLIR